MTKDVDRRNSFTAADNFPIKVVLDEDVIKLTKKGIIPPIHIQHIPTNHCNMNCPFCSCSERDKTLEMDIEEAVEMIDYFATLGTKAVTITGGGEPLIYPHINELIEAYTSRGIQVGLVSNGLAIQKLNPKVGNKLTWFRISNGDHRSFQEPYVDRLATAVESMPDVDWAFSHVVTKKPNLEEIARVVKFANEFNFTHVRLVADLFEPQNIDFKPIKAYLKDNGVSDSRVIYQERKDYERGMDCRIAFLKPLIGPDGVMYACCGVQYAFETPSRDLPQELSLGHWRNYDLLSSRNPMAAGNKCVKCYYTNYNKLLESLVSELKHKEFL